MKKARTPWPVATRLQYVVAYEELQTAHIQLFAGFKFKHFTACDVFARDGTYWRLMAAPRLTPRPASWIRSSRVCHSR